MVTKCKVGYCKIYTYVVDIGAIYIRKFLELKLVGIPEIIAFFVIAFNCTGTLLIFIFVISVMD